MAATWHELAFESGMSRRARPSALAGSEMTSCSPMSSRVGIFIVRHLGQLLLLNQGSAPDPGSVARGDPYARRRCLAGALCAPPLCGNANRILVTRP